MVLSDHEIWMEIGSGRLQFTPPIVADQVSPSAVDLRLSDNFTVFNPPAPAGVSMAIDLAKIENVEAIAEAYGEERTVLAGETFTLMPGQFVLAYTKERVKLPNYLGSVPN